MLNHIEEAVLGGKTRFLRSNIAAIVNYEGFERFCKVFKIIFNKIYILKRRIFKTYVVLLY